MTISGLVVTLHADPDAARAAVDQLGRHPQLVLGPVHGRELPVVATFVDDRAGRRLHDWLAQVPGVLSTNVVFVGLDEDSSATSHDGGDTTLDPAIRHPHGATS